ncbi:phosphatase PAP2 family protein [Caballeronia sp. LZ062]|uniref:phosphatase PAP2 family protein n=1 Tax=unclassified Caballeronia TaxID=2646786 RepID=UPI0028541BFF|nr:MULTISPECIES: phosphatase PAP2 family protein [unclassified Caballeronia]MDR5857773.1 phosphatase PAP2 family protein [Caballeronia sp. LZ050]MDR5869323.1 phosphatase PAP2 family protein [Caballeronia sp. LZ062]
MNPLEAFNRALFLSINATPATPIGQIDIALFVANDFIYLIPALLALSWLFGSSLQRAAAVRACCVTFLALGLAQLIGLVWTHPRPFMIGLGHTFMEHAPDSSFPSDHATVFASVVLTFLFMGLRRCGALIALAGLAVAWSRVRIGVHFPLDMAGALAFACVGHVLVKPLWNRAGDSLMRMLNALYRRLLAWPISRGWLAP